MKMECFQFSNLERINEVGKLILKLKRSIEFKPALSNLSETFQLQKKLSNFARFFPTSLGSFQLKQYFPTSDFPFSRSFQLPFPTSRIPENFTKNILWIYFMDRTLTFGCIFEKSITARYIL